MARIAMWDDEYKAMSIRNKTAQFWETYTLNKKRQLEDQDSRQQEEEDDQQT